MKLLRKKNGQWFTVSVAVGMLMALGGVSQEVSARETLPEVSDVLEQGEIVEAASQDANVEREQVVTETEQLVSELENYAEIADDSVEVETIATEKGRESSEKTAEVEQREASEHTVKDDSREERSTELEGKNQSKVNKPSENSAELDYVLPQEAVQGGDNDQHHPQAENSNQIIHAPQVWQAGYRGEGEVVAIIDSGIDPVHDAFGRLSDMTKARYQTQEQFEKAKLAAGIEYGRWVNEKLIFGYNYIDADIHLKENDLMSHGQHVAGTAVGNPSRPVKLPT